MQNTGTFTIDTYGNQSLDLSGFESLNVGINLNLISKAREENFDKANAFPDITYAEFKELPLRAKEKILASNRIVNTDTYNRTMDHILDDIEVEGKKSDKFEPGQTVATAEATYSLQLRRSPYDFLIASGVEKVVDQLTSNPITKAELEFAIEHFKQTNVKFFNENMWRWVVEDNDGVMPIKISGMRDGTVFIPGEDVVNITGPSEFVAHLEPYFHRVFYESLVATKARMIAEILGSPDRFVEVGLRSALSEELHYSAIHAMYVGGGIRFTSNDAASALYPSIDMGTIGHRYVQSFDSVEEAFRTAIEKLDAVTLLVDLVDSNEGIDLAIRLKEEYRATGKSISVRLDSGTLEDIKNQTKRYLDQTKALGYTDPKLDKIVIEGIETLQDIIEIEAMIENEYGEETKARVLYGAGGLLMAKETSRSDGSSGLKIAQYTNRKGELVDTNKFSNSPGKESHPGKPVTVIVDGKRVTAQAGEELKGNVTELFEVLYEEGNNIRLSLAEEALNRSTEQYRELKRQFDNSGAKRFTELRATSSKETAEKQKLVKERYGLTA